MGPKISYLWRKYGGENRLSKTCRPGISVIRITDVTRRGSVNSGYLGLLWAAGEWVPEKAGGASRIRNHYAVRTGGGPKSSFVRC